MFLQHLKNSCVKDKRVKTIEIVLQEKIKYLIAEELKIYPLEFDKIKNNYTVEKQCSFTRCINEFKSFVNDNPFLADATYKKIFTEMEEKDVFTDDGLKNIRNCIYKIIISDIDELQISEIPEKILQDCMRPSSNFSFTHGRRFFKFLINNKMLDHKYLTPNKNKILNAILQTSDCSEDNLSLNNSMIIFVNHLWNLNTLAHSAIRTQYYHINNFVLFAGVRRKINFIKQDDVIRYLQYLKNEKKYSSSSRSSILTALKRFFRFFADRKAIKYNPAGNIKIKKTEAICKNALTEEEIVQLLGTAYLNYKQFEYMNPPNSKAVLDKWLTARDWAIVSLLICTGIRTKEIVSLHIGSIDFQNRVVKIDGKGDNTYRIRERVIPLTEPLVLSALETYLKLRPASVYSNLFLNMRLEGLNPSGFNLSIKNITNKLFPGKILNVTALRKSFISHCAQKGIDPLVLRQIMGHTSLSTTMKYYLSVKDSQLREVWEKNNPLNYFSKEECEEWII